ncbi:MAG: hypothetical protein J6E38_09725 [Clostridia bacterium]|nr:hypothetical protein [Clostridia bacterium]
MKKRFLILLIFIIVLLIICAFNFKWIYYRLYPFDRITGEYEISVNGKEINPVGEYYEYGNSGKIRLENDTESFKIKGGEYGRYEIGFVLSGDTLYQLTNDKQFKDGGNVDLSIIYYNTNWWHISELDIEIDIVKDNDEWYVCYNLELEEPLENFKTTTSNLSKKIKLAEINNTEILIGI